MAPDRDVGKGRKVITCIPTFSHTCKTPGDASGKPAFEDSPLGDFDQWPDGVEGIGHPREG